MLIALPLMLGLLALVVRGQQGMASLVPTTSAPLIVSNRYQTISLYPVPASYADAANLLTFTNTPPTLSHYFEMYVAQTTGTLNEQYTFAYNTTLGQVMTFKLFVRSNNGNQLQATDCGLLSDLIPDGGSAVLNCDNSSGGHFQVGVGVTIGAFLTFGAPWYVVQNPGNVVPNQIYRFVFSIQYTPSLAASVSNSSSFNYLNLAFTAQQTATNYVAFLASSFANANCPQDCVSCNAQGVCLACGGNFTLNAATNTCQCGTTVSEYPLTTNTSQYTIGGTTVGVYFTQRVCNASVSTYATCISSLLRVDQPLYLNMYTNQSFNSETQATVGINYTSTSNFNALSAACRSYVTVYFYSNLADNPGMFVKLGDPMPFDLTSTRVVDFGSSNSCSQFDYPDFGFTAKLCTLISSFVFQQPLLNQTLFARNNSLITLHDRTSGVLTAYYFLRSYIPNAVFNASTSSWVSALVCLDPDCLTEVTSANVTNGQPLYVRVAFSDPVFLQTSPTVYPILLMNGYRRNSLLLLQEQLLTNEYLFAISLDSLELYNQTNIVLLLSYGVSSPAAYNETEFIGFSVNIPSSLLYFPADPPFVKSSGFVWLMATLGAIVLGLILGPIFWGISKCQKKEGPQATTAFQENEVMGARRFLESNGNSPMRLPSLANRMRANKATPPPAEAAGIFEKLMR